MKLKPCSPYRTHHDVRNAPSWATRDAAGSYVAWHFTKEAADEMAELLNAAYPHTEREDIARRNYHDPRAAQIRALEWCCDCADRDELDRKIADIKNGEELI